jgi:hypothetical protein
LPPTTRHPAPTNHHNTTQHSGIIAEVLTADGKLRDAVGANDSSLLSKESLQTLSTTLHNWGALIAKNLGSTSDDVDDQETESEDSSSGGSSEETAAAAAKAAKAAARISAAQDGAGSVDAARDDPKDAAGLQEEGLRVSVSGVWMVVWQAERAFCLDCQPATRVNPSQPCSRLF